MTTALDAIDTLGLTRTVARLKAGDKVRITLAPGGHQIVGETFAWASEEQILLVIHRGVDYVVRRIDGTPGRFITNVELWDRDSRLKAMRLAFEQLFALDAELVEATTSEMGEVQKRIDEQEQAIADEWLPGVAS